VNKLGNTLKFVSGIILFVVGVIISYEVITYNLIDVLLMVGFLIAIVGIILIISYFVDENAEKTGGIIKEFLNSADINTSSINLSKRNSKSRSYSDNNGPLIVRPENDDYDYDYGEDIDDSGLWEYYEDQDISSSSREYYAVPEDDDSESKTVLRVVNREEREVDLDNELDFTPTYDKPIKVTRKPKKRSREYAGVPRTEETPDKTEEIKRALSEEPEPEIPAQTVSQSRDIEIDVNNPERLPIPSSLKGNVLVNDNLIASNDAFEELAVSVNKEIMLEIPSLNVLSDRFLSHVPTIYSRVIIDEFDLSDISYTVLIASLLKQGVHIKTVPKVHAINLITDDSHAMIISDGYVPGNPEYGAIYDDRTSISNIRSDFEKTWDIAANLDETVILNSIAGGNA
jgi:hypothetical protein